MKRPIQKSIAAAAAVVITSLIISWGSATPRPLPEVYTTSTSATFTMVLPQAPQAE